MTRSARFVLVLGMHRSGTSCLAGALECCGVYLGEVGRSDKHNAKGNLEHDAARLLDDRILELNGGTWAAPPERLLVAPPQAEAMRAIVQDLLARAPAGLKDPRTLLVVREWIAAIGEASPIGTFRHPHAVALSLEKRNGLSREAAFALWLRYNRELVRLHRERPFPILAFDLRDPPAYCATVAAVAERLGLRPDRRRILEFVSAELDHGGPPPSEVPASCRETFEYLESVREPWMSGAASGAAGAPGAKTSGAETSGPHASGAPAGRARLHLVSGPSCAGKSQYISRHLSDHDAVLLPDKGAAGAVRPGGRFVVHYNLLRPYEKLRTRGGAPWWATPRRWRRQVRSAIEGPFAIDKRLGELLASGAELEATVLVVPREELLARLAARRADEPLQPGEEVHAADTWRAVLAELDLHDVYADWLEFLRASDIPFRLVDATDGAYRPLGEDALAEALAR